MKCRVRCLILVQHKEVACLQHKELKNASQAAGSLTEECGRYGFLFKLTPIYTGTNS